MSGDSTPARERMKAPDSKWFAEAVPEQQPARADQRLADEAQFCVQRDRLAALVLKVHLEVILQVPAYAGPFDDRLDAGPVEHVAGADTGQLQQRG